ncbi:MAG: hypothetical protein QG599_1870 [Pseudomonadota bacterium]|nr:hypothetical protein [Pseudomonadota bacterium]
MLIAVEGIYENGAIRLLEPMPGVIRGRVVITLLPDQEKTSDTPRKTLRTMNSEERRAYQIEMKNRWKNQLSSSEEFAQAKSEEIALENRYWSE